MFLCEGVYERACAVLGNYHACAFTHMNLKKRL